MHLEESFEEDVLVEFVDAKLVVAAAWKAVDEVWATVEAGKVAEMAVLMGSVAAFETSVVVLFGSTV